MNKKRLTDGWMWLWALLSRPDQDEEKCDECKMSMADHTTCECCKEPMCEEEDTVDMPEGWYHPDCYSDVYE